MKDKTFDQVLENMIEKYYQLYINTKKCNPEDFPEDEQNHLNSLKNLVLLDFLCKKDENSETQESETQEVEFAGFSVQGNSEFIKATKSKNKQNFSVMISSELLGKTRDVVYWINGLTLQDFVERSIEKHIAFLEKNVEFCHPETGKPFKISGEPFPERK